MREKPLRVGQAVMELVCIVTIVLLTSASGERSGTVINVARGGVTALEPPAPCSQLRPPHSVTHGCDHMNQLKPQD